MRSQRISPGTQWDVDVVMIDPQTGWGAGQQKGISFSGKRNFFSGELSFNDELRSKKRSLLVLGYVGAADPRPIDLKRLMHIIKSSGYRGYIPIETLSVAGQDYDAFKVVPAFIDQVRQAIAQVS